MISDELKISIESANKSANSDEKSANKSADSNMESADSMTVLTKRQEQILTIMEDGREYFLQRLLPESPETFCVNLFRKALPERSDGDVGENVGDSSEKFGESSVKFGESSAKNTEKFGEITLNGTQMEIVQRVEADNRISAKHISEELSLSVRSIEKNIKELRDKGVLVRHGSARGGYWEVVK